MDRNIDSGSARVVLPLFDVDEYRGCKAGFEEYDKEHPGIWIRFEGVAVRRINRGDKRLGAKAIIEEIREDCRRKGDEPYALDNTYSSDYARMFENRHPRHKGLFEFRMRKI